MSIAPPLLERAADLRPYTTLRAGGPADILVKARTWKDLVQAVQWGSQEGLLTAVLGWGSNLLPSDRGFRGLVIINLAQEVEFQRRGKVVASTGVGFQDLFLRCAQRSLSGLEFAVGIPGTLGGALVSNAGAYRSGISALVTKLEIVEEGGEPAWVDPSRLEFGYRDSILRRPNPPRLVVTRVGLQMAEGSAREIYNLARENQRQRISKQPPPASAGSFFKNVVSEALAQEIEGLTEGMRKAGVVPAGFLIEQAGLKGLKVGGAQVHPRHANFITNVGGASASDIRRLAEEVKAKVQSRFDVVLEEEALYFGDWSGWPATG